jgi:hypothetical protein
VKHWVKLLVWQQSVLHLQQGPSCRISKSESLTTALCALCAWSTDLLVLALSRPAKRPGVWCGRHSQVDALQGAYVSTHHPMLAMRGSIFGHQSCTLAEICLLRHTRAERRPCTCRLRGLMFSVEGVPRCRRFSVGHYSTHLVTNAHSIIIGSGARRCEMLLTVWLMLRGASLPAD